MSAETDGRRQRGQRTRAEVAAQAAALASLDGLSGMTLSQLATRLGVAKSSIQAAYATKEDLQVAAVGAAIEIFVENVVAPAQPQPAGRPRLEALVDGWISYVTRRVFPGGCFMIATLSEFDSHPGAVRDALAQARHAWLAMLEQEAAAAQAKGEIPAEPPAEMVAFEIDALLGAANVSRNLTDDLAPLTAARRLIDLRLGVPAVKTRSKAASGRRR
ncbi:MAG: TetR/AcrR family transcriptional regulator [Acidimicrobiaceae bacterium]|nr:TetR/AcrR family transcriptional regulator [Acidimicrobiaceae bacterium]